jgi:hypothetical protein
MNNATPNARSGGLLSAESNVLTDLAQALQERLAIIHDEESRRDEAKHIARLRAISERIGKLQEALPQPIDSRLAHYLQRRSYDKVLEYLEGMGAVPSLTRTSSARAQGSVSGSSLRHTS